MIVAYPIRILQYSMNPSILRNHTKKAAFTLVELSIVLVIIGLLIGGLLLGKDLIKLADINKTIVQMGEYSSALNAFKLKYDGIPGDISNASVYGLDKDATGTTNTCYGSATSTSLNGNGNGLLSSRQLGMWDGEIPNYFIHLSNSGLIKDKFYGLTSPVCSSTPWTAGQQYPAASVGNSIITVTNYADSKLYYVLGGFDTTKTTVFTHASEGTSNGIAGNYLTTEESMAIDNKLDDGAPLTGTVKVIITYALSGGYASLAVDNVNNSSNCVYNNIYNASINTKVCTLAARIP